MLFGVSKDISDLRLSEEKFSKTFQASGALMALTTFAEGMFIDVNEAFLETIGYTRDEVIGKTSEELNLFVDMRERDAVRDKVLECGRARRAELRVRTKDGRIRHGLFSADPLYIQDTPYLLTTMNDVTELKRLEQELREHRDHLEQEVAERTSELNASKEELEVRSSTLQEVNTALRVLARQIGQDKEEMEARFLSNMKSLILPYVEKIKRGRLDPEQQSCINIIEANLNEIASTFLQSRGAVRLYPEGDTDCFAHQGRGKLPKR